MIDAPDLLLHYGAHPDQCIDLWHGGAQSGSRALIVLLHGGFWRPVYDRAHMVPMAQALARAGWSVANVEYRREPGNPDVTMRDVSAALEFLAVEPRAVPADGRMVVAGFSAGGHLALWLAATSTNRRLVGALGMAPVADLRCAAALKLGNGALDLFLGAHRDRLATLDPAQLPMPTRAVTLIHGETDDTVPIAVSKAYLSVHSTMRLRCVPGAGHFPLVDPESEAWPAVVEELARLADQPAR